MTDINKKYAGSVEKFCEDTETHHAHPYVDYVMDEDLGTTRKEKFFCQGYVNDIVPEEWVRIEGYPQYEVSSLGNFRRTKDHREIKKVAAGRNFWQVTLYENKMGRKFTAHRLVAKAFVKGYSEHYEVEFLNGDFLDMRAANIAMTRNLVKRHHRNGTYSLRSVA